MVQTGETKEGVSTVEPFTIGSYIVADMEKVMTISDWWDGPLCGLATYKGFICIYERIFDEAKDEWSNEYYLTPIDEESSDLLLKDWNVWYKTIRGEKSLDDYYLCNRNNYHNIIETSVRKRVYRRTGVFCGHYEKGFIPIDYCVEWTEGKNE